MTPSMWGTLERRLSNERLSPYVVAAGHSLDRKLRALERDAAIALYEWNASISGSMWTPLGHLEVVVRNAMHGELSHFSQQEYGDSLWYAHLGHILADRTRIDITKARNRCQASPQGRPETTGRVIAELSFGFWSYLLAKRYENTLWQPCLRNAFPYLRGVGMRRDVQNALAQLHDLRNRIAHHEPIHNRPLHRLYDALLTVIGWICPETRDWVARHSNVSDLLAACPI